MKKMDRDRVFDFICDILYDSNVHYTPSGDKGGWKYNLSFNNFSSSLSYLLSVMTDYIDITVNDPETEESKDVLTLRFSTISEECFKQICETTIKALINNINDEPV